MVRKYRKEDGSKVADNFFARIKNTLNKYGQIDSGYVNKNSKEKKDGMILSQHHKRIISDGYDYISSYGIKRYSELLADEYGRNWDGIRKEIGLMKRYGVIQRFDTGVSKLLEMIE